MNECLAVESHQLGLTALGGESLNIADVVVDPIQNSGTGCPSRQHAHLQRRGHRGAASHVRCAQLLSQIVRAHDEHRQTVGGLRDVKTVQHRPWGLDHGP